MKHEQQHVWCLSDVWVLTYRHGRLLRVSSDHLDGDPGADERPHGLFDPGPGRVDDAHQTQEGQVPHLSTGRKRQNYRERQTDVCSVFMSRQKHADLPSCVQTVYLWVRRCPCSWSAAGTAPSAGGWATVCFLCCCRSCRVGSPARTLPSWSKLQVCPDDVKNRAEDEVRRYKSYL